MMHYEWIWYFVAAFAFYFVVPWFIKKFQWLVERRKNAVAGTGITANPIETVHRQAFIGYLITASVAMVVLILFAFGYTVYQGGDVYAFWSVIGAMAALSVAFGMSNYVGNLVAWKIYLEKRHIAHMVATLKEGNLPIERSAGDYLLKYVEKILYDEDTPQKVKAAAQEIYELQRNAGSAGLIAGWRMMTAWEKALDIYAPLPAATGPTRKRR